MSGGSARTDMKCFNDDRAITGNVKTYYLKTMFIRRLNETFKIKWADKRRKRKIVRTEHQDEHQSVDQTAQAIDKALCTNMTHRRLLEVPCIFYDNEHIFVAKLNY